jgi:hypothetical protein
MDKNSEYVIYTKGINLSSKLKHEYLDLFNCIKSIIEYTEVSNRLVTFEQISGEFSSFSCKTGFRSLIEWLHQRNQVFRKSNSWNFSYSLETQSPPKTR